MENDTYPLTSESLGNKTWSLLHTMAAYYPDEPTFEQQNDMNQFLIALGHLYPCRLCALDFSQMLIDRPPETSCQKSLSEWLCMIHNRVNKKIDKAIFDCTKCDERWRDGPQ